MVISLLERDGSRGLVAWLLPTWHLRLVTHTPRHTAFFLLLFSWRRQRPNRPDTTPRPP